MFIALFLFAGLATGCRPEQKKKENSPGEAHRGDRSLPDDNRQCASIEALEILSDGNTVVSRMSENSWLTWKLDTKKVMAKGFSLSYFAASADGRYMLSQNSYGSYKIMEAAQGRYRQKGLFRIRSGDIPDMRFSGDSKRIIIRYRPFNSRGLDQFDLYDIEKGSVYKTFKAAGIKHIRLSRDGASLIMGYDNGFEKFIAKYDLDSLNEIFRIKLPHYRSFSYMEISSNRIIAKSKNTYFVYGLNSGELLFQSDYKHIYEVDRNSNLALAASDWGEVAVVDLEDGVEVFHGRSPKEVILSTCRLKSSPLRVACRERLEQNKILVWGIESGENFLTCY